MSTSVFLVVHSHRSAVNHAHRCHVHYIAVTGNCNSCTRKRRIRAHTIEKAVVVVSPELPGRTALHRIERPRGSETKSDASYSIFLVDSEALAMARVTCGLVAGEKGMWTVVESWHAHIARAASYTHSSPLDRRVSAAIFASLLARWPRNKPSRGLVTGYSHLPSGRIALQHGQLKLSLQSRVIRKRTFAL